MWKNKIVFVTGARGFIGKNLVNKLENLGVRVKTLEGDLCDSRCIPIIERINPDYIFHLASNVGGIEYLLSNEYQVALDNTTMSINVLNAARKCSNLKGFLFTSSACVYPKTGGLNLVEEDVYPADPHSSYGWSKLYIERLVKYSGIPAVNVRLANTYGPHGHFKDPTQVIPTLITNIRKCRIADVPFTIFGDGSQSREFIYVDDVVEGMLQAIVCVTDGSAINIGTAKAHTIREVIMKLTKIIGVFPTVLYDMTKPVGETQRSLDNTKAKIMLNWSPKISLDGGLQKTCTWVCEDAKDLLTTS